MHSKSTSLIVVGMILLLVSFIGYDIFSQPTKTTIKTCIPTFEDGDGPYYKANAPFTTKIVPDKNNGERLIIRGRLLKNDCTTAIPNAVLDIWQADETGTYRDTSYRGKITTNATGNYMFETVKPKGYGKGTAYRPPHIHFKVVINNKVMITSEMFFPDVKGRPDFQDAFIMSLSQKNILGFKWYEGYHDIIMP